MLDSLLKKTEHCVYQNHKITMLTKHVGNLLKVHLLDTALFVYLQACLSRRIELKSLILSQRVEVDHW